MTLVSETYKITRDFPDFEKFGLVSQMSWCSVSMSSNIAKGSGGSDKAFSNFLDYSIGSSYELGT